MRVQSQAPMTRPDADNLLQSFHVIRIQAFDCFTVSTNACPTKYVHSLTIRQTLGSISKKLK